ncbi:glycosyltransferase [Curvibacter lanceolatus]|uniref:glycosyltransferase n=1 Tax=Curvibacter lanceolatus TaxID=86182 RepID=UPI0003A95879|nr:glycosyltransferase [Curvibacter lanceolatus]
MISKKDSSLQVLNNLRIAISHEWLSSWGGSEDVVRAIVEIFPSSHIYAIIDFLSDLDRRKFCGAPISTSFIQNLPFAEKWFWNYLPLMPMAVEGVDLSDYDVIISSSHAFSKGVLTNAQQMHVSYVHSPMRYAWDLHFQYLQDYRLERGVKSILARWIFHKLRVWERQTSNNVDFFIANSKHVQQRVWRTYRRPSRVIYPPVKVTEFQCREARDDYYLVVSRLVSYKKVNLIMEAFRTMPNRRLVIIGDGPEYDDLLRKCPPNVEMLGWQPDPVVQKYMAAAQAFVFAALEDFGISPVEAQASGAPVIAFGTGGAAETVRCLKKFEHPTGILFDKQSTESILEAVVLFENSKSSFSPDRCREWAENFSEQAFKQNFEKTLDTAWCLWNQDKFNAESYWIQSRN